MCTFVSWIEGNGYQIIGSNREVYITGGNEQDNESYYHRGAISCNQGLKGICKPGNFLATQF
ncbi:hypothetical protein [Fischerella thermalis]|uniref:hypothetical protein n=1 Tax=Fischerella thermalis TaxID=372787 RepID=UPI00215505B3|nr:hypothetical protein [Fischerella thermalis]